MADKNTWPEDYESESFDEEAQRLVETGNYRFCLHCGALRERLEHCSLRCELKDDELVERAEERERAWYEA